MEKDCRCQIRPSIQLISSLIVDIVSTFFLLITTLSLLRVFPYQSRGVFKTLEASHE
jgi:maltodextrin utilization protein YvdJ